MASCGCAAQVQEPELPPPQWGGQKSLLAIFNLFRDNARRVRYGAGRHFGPQAAVRSATLRRLGFQPDGTRADCLPTAA
jgi:hypothetical protein